MKDSIVARPLNGHQAGVVRDGWCAGCAVRVSALFCNHQGKLLCSLRHVSVQNDLCHVQCGNFHGANTVSAGDSDNKALAARFCALFTGYEFAHGRSTQSTERREEDGKGDQILNQARPLPVASGVDELTTGLSTALAGLKMILNKH